MVEEEIFFFRRFFLESKMARQRSVFCWEGDFFLAWGSKLKGRRYIFSGLPRRSFAGENWRRGLVGENWMRDFVGEN